MKTFLFTALAFLFTAQSFAQKNLDSLTVQKKNTEQVVIRCAATINNANTSLFIIDGVPQFSNDNVLINFAPEEIRSIKVVDGPLSFGCFDSFNYDKIVFITTKEDHQPIVLMKDLPFRVYSVCNTNWVLPQDMYNAIEAKVPGVRISANTSTNQVPNIRMRGNDNTIVIVDGIRYDASILKTLNPADIESVKVSNSSLAQNYFVNQ